MAKHEKHEHHSQTLLRIAADELEHYNIWKGYTNADVSPKRLKVAFLCACSVVLGYTFVLRLMESGEQRTAKAYGQMSAAVPEITHLIATENAHEEQLVAMLDEERLKYVGAIVLGLNDALVELTGVLAGLTLALANTRLIALSGIITGVAATLSMAASNYLAEKADDNPHALKASIYTGAAYLLTVVVLVTPYLFFGENDFWLALAVMLIGAVLVILIFNFYISVAQNKSFLKQFGSMAIISLSVAAISFAIGIAAKAVLGVDI
ncbi:MAG: VIT1/CCC1 family protein [Coriobacteriales bacterium]|jgi:VIT1/CCC1 family predicted Fe2+/Mn2+ transporter|nr:VIT1/CCC1 family protein [Coriobacteriales bacterium]